MKASIRAELMLLTRSRAVRWSVVTAWLFAAVVTGGLLSTYGSEQQAVDVSTAAGQAEVLIDPLSGLVVLALGVVLAAGDFRTGAVVWTYLATPERWRWAAAKVVVAALLGAVVGVVAELVKLGTLAALQPAGAGPVQWSQGVLWQAVAGSVISPTALAVAGAALGLATRNVAGAITGALVWIVVLEGVVRSFLPEAVVPFLPHTALAELRNLTGTAPYAQSATVVGVTLAVLVAGALVLTQRRDLTR